MVNYNPKLEKYILICIFLFSINIYGQNYNIEFYTLGVLSDYLGRQIIKDEIYSDSLVDRYHRSRLYIPERLTSLIDSSNKINKRRIIYSLIRNPENSEFYFFLSRELTIMINHYHNYYYTHSRVLPENYKIYRGEIKKYKILFSNKCKQASYLSAAFLVHGEYKNGDYNFWFGNSVKKYEIVKKLLKKNDCEITKIEVDTTPNVAPRIRKIYFIPSERIKKLLDRELLYIPLKNDAFQ